jgi:hypothetical protein
LLRGAFGVSLAGRCMAWPGARTGGATYVSKGSKGFSGLLQAAEALRQSLCDRENGLGAFIPWVGGAPRGGRKDSSRGVWGGVATQRISGSPGLRALEPVRQIFPGKGPTRPWGFWRVDGRTGQEVVGGKGVAESPSLATGGQTVGEPGGCRVRAGREELRGVFGASLFGRSAARPGARTGGANHRSKGGKELGRRVGLVGTNGVSWHRGCAPLHTNQSTRPGLPTDRWTPRSRPCRTDFESIDQGHLFARSETLVWESCGVRRQEFGNEGGREGTREGPPKTPRTRERKRPGCQNGRPLWSLPGDHRRHLHFDNHGRVWHHNYLIQRPFGDALPAPVLGTITLPSSSNCVREP